MRSGTIQVEGLGALSKALADFGPEVRKELRKANYEVADDVADEAQGRALSVGGVAAHVAPTIKASAGLKSAGVALQGDAAAGAEFGANRDGQRKRSSGTYIGYRQFKPWRGAGSNAGYFLYPTIRDNADQIKDTYQRDIDRLTARLFPQ